jgi:hypothetical protein
MDTEEEEAYRLGEVSSDVEIDPNDIDAEELEDEEGYVSSSNVDSSLRPPQALRGARVRCFYVVQTPTRVGCCRGRREAVQIAEEETEEVESH